MTQENVSNILLFLETLRQKEIERFSLGVFAIDDFDNDTYSHLRLLSGDSFPPCVSTRFRQSSEEE